LLGEAVRFDAGDKRDRYVTEVLGEHFDWVPVCPEVELGLGTPREPVRLELESGAIRMRGIDSRDDHTRAMRRFASVRARELTRADLCGYVFKAKSPSCGMERVHVHRARGVPRKAGRGLFAEALMERLPNLPVEEEGRLNDPELRENWIERVFAYRRLRSLLATRASHGRLVEFHEEHELQLLAHSPGRSRNLGRLVARAKGVPPGELRERYSKEFMEILTRRATRRLHRNVLLHALGRLRGAIDSATHRRLHERIEEYGGGLVPLIVPITLVRHLAERLDIEYLAHQTYLDPHPRELNLRNRV
jgi:uncharacterized protein YbgA (DUF1722 family)/uncharacterized protein YbbK (DUF523 family)